MLIHHIVEIVDADLGIEDVRIVTDLLIEALLAIILILDVANNLFNQILNGDQASNGTIFVNNDDHMHPILTYLAQQVVKLFGLWHKIRRTDQGTDLHAIVIVAQLFEQVFRVQNTDNLIDTNFSFVDWNTRETTLQGQINGFRYRYVTCQSNHIDTWHQHLAPGLGEAQGQHSCHAGGDNHSYAIDNQDRREEGIGFREQLFNLDCARIALFDQVFQFNTAHRSKRCFSSRGNTTKN